MSDKTLRHIKTAVHVKLLSGFFVSFGKSGTKMNILTLRDFTSGNLPFGLSDGKKNRFTKRLIHSDRQGYRSRR